MPAGRGPFRTGCTDSCPKHISIPGLFADMNAKQLYHDWNADCYCGVVHTGPGRKASDCLKCGKCETVCPSTCPSESRWRTWQRNLKRHDGAERRRKCPPFADTQERKRSRWS